MIGEFSSSVRESRVLIDSIAQELNIPTSEVLNTCRELGIPTPLMKINVGTRGKPRYVAKSTVSRGESEWIIKQFHAQQEENAQSPSTTGSKDLGSAHFIEQRWINSEQLAQTRERLRGATLLRCTLSNLDLTNEDLSGLKLIECELTNVNLSNAILTNACIEKSKVYNCQFKATNLEHSIICNTTVIRGLFDAAQLSNVAISDSVVRSSLVAADVSRSKWVSVVADRCDFRDAVLRNSSFDSMSLQNSEFGGADTTNVQMSGVNLRGSNFVTAIVNGLVLQECQLDGMMRAHFNADGSLKRSFTTRAQADFSVRANHEPRSSKMSSYKCPICSMWHVGHSRDNTSGPSTYAD